MSQFQSAGYALIDALIPPDLAASAAIASEELWEGRSTRRGGVRGVLSRNKMLRDIGDHSAILKLVTTLGQGKSRRVRSIFFDKTPETNWLVPWHQDMTIAVRKRIETAGYGPWSVKDDAPHCQPPLRVLASMFTIRIHLDPCGHESGPLRVIPGTHRHGVLRADQIEAARRQPFVECLTDLGGVVVMHPLVLHASPKADRPGHRRVLHIEYATSELDGGLAWHEAC